MGWLSSPGSASRQFFNVVGDAVELPLAIHPFAAPQTEPIQAFVVAQVAEHRFHRGETAGDHRAPGRAVDTPAHAAQGIVLFGFRQDEGNLAGCSLIGSTQALFALQAAQAVAQRAFELDRRLALERAVTAVAVQGFTRWTDARLVQRVELEIGRGIAAAADGLGAFIPERVGFLCVAFLPGISLVPLAVAVIGNVDGDAAGFQVLQRLAAVVAGIGGKAGG